MQILFFINGIHPGGKERRMLELMKQIKLLPQYDFELVVMNNEINYPEIFELGINIHYLIRNSKKDFSIFHKFYKICKHYKPDIVHCWDGMTAVYSIPACRILNISLVNGMIVNSPLKSNFFNKNWLRGKVTFPFSTIIIGNSYSGLQAYGAPSKKSFLIHNGFNFKRIENLIPPKEIYEELDIKTQYIVGMVATFSEFKDYKTYYKAASIILKNRKDITFLAIGSNTDSTDSHNLIPLDFKQYFRLLGKKNHIESYINVMDVCVLSTFSEGISNSILEYMALGKPVIASSGGGTSEIVLDKQTGYIVKNSDPPILARNIEKLINNWELRKKMGLLGQERIKNHFSIDSMVEKYIYHYSIIRRKNSKKLNIELEKKEG